MPISAFPYIGGKSELAPWIVDHLPEHECYVEPFGGSASVLLAKPRSTVEVLNDLDEDIVQFFRTVRDRPDDLREFVNNIPYSRSLFEEWADHYYNGYRPGDAVERAGQWVFLRYAAFGGKYGRKTGFKRASHLNSQPPSKIWAQVPDRVGLLRDRLSGVEIECDPATTVIDAYDSEDTLVYCDPPYPDTSRDYYRENEVSHQALEAALAGMAGEAVVSYATVPPPFEEGWHIRERGYTQRARRGSMSDWNSASIERLCCSFDPAEVPTFVNATECQTTFATVEED